MSSMIFIMAAGKAERHNGGNKPLLVVEGETLLDRMCRQAAGIRKYIVTHRDDLKNENANVLVPKSHDFFADTLLSTVPYWKERNIILWGDVYYTDEVMKEIMAEERPLVAFGDNRDIYAAVFKMSEPVDWWLTKYVDAVRNNRHETGFFRGLIFAGFSKFVRVTDGTFDFDSPQEYKQFLNKERRHV